MPLSSTKKLVRWFFRLWRLLLLGCTAAPCALGAQNIAKLLCAHHACRLEPRLVPFEHRVVCQPRVQCLPQRSVGRRSTIIGRITSRYCPRRNTSLRTSSAMFQINETICACDESSIIKSLLPCQLKQVLQLELSLQSCLRQAYRYHNPPRRFQAKR